MGFREIFSANHEWAAATAEGGTDIKQLIGILRQQPRMKGELGDIELLLERHAVEGFDIVQMYLDAAFLSQMTKDERVVRAG